MVFYPFYQEELLGSGRVNTLYTAIDVYVKILHPVIWENLVVAINGKKSVTNKFIEHI